MNAEPPASSARRHRPTATDAPHRPRRAVVIGRRTDGFDIVLVVLLAVVIVLPPLALGAVAPWARNGLFLVALGLVAVWLMAGAWRGEVRLARTSAWAFIAAFFGVALLQLVPLSPDRLAAVSPEAAATYARALPDGEVSAVRPLSLAPHATRAEVVRLATLALVFFVVVNTVRRRWQIVALLLVLAGMGTFEVLYGFAEQFSGRQHIFWLPRRYHLSAVTGTFHNKNHFAGLLEMIVPATLGLLVGLSRRGWPVTTSQRNRLRRTLASSRVHRQVVLAALVVIMVVAVFFSLSRAGILCTVAVLVAFVACLGAAAGFRRYTVVMFLIVAAVLSVAAGLGVELVISGVEDVATGRSTSWLDRVDLARSATACIRDYPLVGTGLGTFGLVFPRYQSGRFGDRWADFLHNDALQLVCEMGVIGALILLVGLGVVIGGTVRVIRGRRDPFARWTATGALLGVGAILLHSLFDYNLSKITANGLVCAVLLGVAFAAARTSGSRSSRTRRLRYWRVPLAKPLARAGVGLVAVGLLASIPFFPMISALRADIHFNRYLAGVDEPDDYFFLPVARPARAGGMPADDSTTSTEALDRALALCPDNPRYLAEAAGRAWARADDRLRQRAVERAHAILGSDLERRDPTGFERIVAAIASTIRPQVLDERRPLLDEAEAHLRRAIAAVPTAARYHLDLADVLAELDPTRRHVSEIGREVRVALSLAPNRPAVLFDAGRLLLLAAVPAEESPSDTTLRLALVQDCFRQAMEADVAYGSLIYPLVQATMGGRSALLAVTPHTVEAYEQLYHVLWQAGEWVPALACLDTLEALAESDGALAAGSGYTADADSGSRRLQVKTFVAQRRGDVLGILGRWGERAEAVSHYRALLRRRLAEDVAEAHRLRTMGRPQEALAVCLRLLQGDWSNPDALLEAAEIATLPRVLDGLPRWNTSFDLLYRLVINNTVLSPSVYERATKVLDGLVLRQASDRLVAAFIRGALAVLAGRASEGTAVLDGLAEREDDVIAGWRQRHLIWYYLGLGHEAMHDRAKAIAAYRRVVDIVPTHRLSLLRLCDLYAGAVPSEGSSARESARSVASRLAALTPEVPCAVNFGGHVTLLGYTLSQDNRSSQMAGAAPGRGRWTMTYYWQFHERLFDGYQLAVHFCNARWDTLFYGDYRIRSDGQPYPQDSPRCGEVVVERKTLVADPAGVAYVRIFFWSTKGQYAIPRELSVDGGGTACEVPFRRPDVRPDGGRSGM